MDHQHANIVRLGHRAAHAHAHAHAGPVAITAPAMGTMDPIMNIEVPTRLLEARADTTSSTPSPTGSCGVNPCEKGVSDQSMKLPIILGVAIPVVGSMILFFFLHRRHVRKQREEDSNDRHASMDFGLGDVPRPGAPTKKYPARIDTNYGGDDEKDHQSRRQVSMDMALDSPYLLAPELQNSRGSIHSMSRHTNQQEDPYRPVNQYHPGDAQSFRSQSKQGSSIYTGSSKAASRVQENGTSELLANAEPMPRSAAAFVPPPRQNSLPTKSAAYNSSNEPAAPPPYPLPAEPSAAYLADSLQRKGLPTNPRPGNNLEPQTSNGDRDSYAGDTAGLRQSNNYLGAFIHEKDLDLSLSTNPYSTTPPAPLTKSVVEVNIEPVELPTPPPAVANLPANPRPVRKEPIAFVQPQAATYVDNESDYGDAFNITPPSPNRANHADVTRGQRYSMDVPPEEYVQAGLGAPGFDARRLSMGFRPLPPDAATEHDDPEIRANRIRSFYKEYFDESKPAPQGQYYEDYDQSYLDQSHQQMNRQQPSYQQQGYYDPSSNAFVMPFAEPIQRRAMTPPPQGPQGNRPPPRFQGQGPPRPRNGSMGAMSTMSGRGRQPPQMYPPGPYPQGPKAYSSASGRGGGNQKRNLPPPEPLNTLPTPSKLKDDSFALFNSMDFAPPQTYRDRVQGRSESPLGERRPYSPALPAFAPIASSFEELAPVPSPHTLRKSGTFTGLDFAPPKRFKDPENMSDAGSIRSNRSGISAMQNNAIRNGAYRVSKIPQDVVFTKDDMSTTLKPQWGMRQN